MLHALLATIPKIFQFQFLFLKFFLILYMPKVTPTPRRESPKGRRGLGRTGKGSLQGVDEGREMGKIERIENVSRCQYLNINDLLWGLTRYGKLNYERTPSHRVRAKDVGLPSRTNPQTGHYFRFPLRPRAGS